MRIPLLVALLAVAACSETPTAPKPSAEVLWPMPGATLDLSATTVPVLPSRLQPRWDELERPAAQPPGNFAYQATVPVWVSGSCPGRAQLESLPLRATGTQDGAARLPYPPDWAGASGCRLALTDALGVELAACGPFSVAGAPPTLKP